MRKGDRIIDDVEMKALSVGTDVDGGYTVHPDVSGRIVSRVFETSPMRAYASVVTISTDALEGMYDTDEAAASWVGETQTRSETDTPELGAWRIPVHELQAMPKATQKILDDSAINIEDMADPATGSLSLASGNMRETYQIVDRLGIRVLRDPYSSKPHVLFYTTKRVGGDVVNFESLKLIKMAA